MFSSMLNYGNFPSFKSQTCLCNRNHEFFHVCVCRTQSKESPPINVLCSLVAKEVYFCFPFNFKSVILAIFQKQCPEIYFKKRKTLCSIYKRRACEFPVLWIPDLWNWCWGSSWWYPRWEIYWKQEGGKVCFIWNV